MMFSFYPSIMVITYLLLEMAFVAPAALQHLINYKSHLLLHRLNLQEHYHLTIWLPKATKGKLLM